MGDYIEREALLKYSRAMLERAKEHIRKGSTESEFWQAVHQTQREERAEFVSLLENAPAADVAPVVRCKDCRYRRNAKVNENGFLICPASGMEITETDYCSYGALMDGKEADHETSQHL